MSHTFLLLALSAANRSTWLTVAMQPCQLSCQHSCGAWLMHTWLQARHKHSAALHVPSCCRTKPCTSRPHCCDSNCAVECTTAHASAPTLTSRLVVMHLNNTYTCGVGKSDRGPMVLLLPCVVPAGQLEDAEVALREVLGFDLPLSEKLPVLAQLADVQLKEDSVETQAKVAAQLADKIKEAGGDSSKVCWLDATAVLGYTLSMLSCCCASGSPFTPLRIITTYARRLHVIAACVDSGCHLCLAAGPPGPGAKSAHVAVRQCWCARPAGV